MKLNLIKDELFSKYFETITLLKEKFEALKDAEISTESFSFYTSVSSVFSSKIEEEYMELDSYIKHKKFGINFQPNYTKKIDNLYNAYIFAQSNKLTIKNIKKAHKLLSKNIVETHKQGQFRTQNMYVTTDDGRIEYVAASPFELRDEMNKWGQDLDVLISQEMNYKKYFIMQPFCILLLLKYTLGMTETGEA